MDHHMNSNQSSTPSDAMAGMSMSTIFSTNTRITLFFTEWTTTTAAEYFGTILALFFLTVLNRFLGALKFQVERAWSDEPPKIVFSPPPNGRNARASFKPKRPSPIPSYTVREDDCEWDPLAASMQGETSNNSPEELDPKEQSQAARLSLVQRMFGTWNPSAPWDFKKDVLRATLEFARAFIGYIL